MKLLLVNVILIFCFGLNANNVQKQDSSRHKQSFIRKDGIKLGSNFAWYKTNYGRYNLNNIEFTLGYSLGYNIASSVDINLSIQTGVKKGKQYNHRFDLNNGILNPNIEDPIYAYYAIDKFDKVLSKNHYFIEIPITTRIRLLKPIGLNLGYSFRYYFPKSTVDDYDFIFNNLFENGILCGMSVHITNKLILNGNYVFALKNTYSDFIITDNKVYHSILRSNQVQFNILFLFK